MLSGELFLVGAQITPLIQASTHVVANDRRTRKLLMHRREILKLRAFVEQKGHTLVPLSLYMVHGRVKVEIGVCKGKAAHDKRETLLRRESDRDAERAIARHYRG